MPHRAVIRAATPSDLEALIELGGEYCAADGHDFDAAVVREGFAPLLADARHGRVWVAELDGEVDGYAVATWGWSVEIGGREAVLDEVYVRTRGRGIGAALIEQLEAECRASGVRRIFLETESPNDDARRLYTRLGYATESSIWMAKEL